MRVLLDHNMPHWLRGRLPDHEVVTAGYLHWDRLRNGELLRAAAGEFDALFTLDKGYETEQAMSQHDIAVFLLRPRTQSFGDVLRMVEKAARLLTTCRPGRLYVIEPEEEGEEPRSG